MRKPRRRILAAFLVVATLAGCTSSGDPKEPGADGEVDEGTVSRAFVPKKAYLKDACEMDPDWALRLHRGWTPGKARDYDLIVVPQARNYVGSFINTSHSGPYGFLQNVPLVLYGPGFIEPKGRFDPGREVTIADLAPTYAELMGFDEWPERPSSSIGEVLKATDRTPKLIFTAVIDGGGWNYLNRWPDTWPTIARLIEEGANVDGATVGSSPSITPATHTNLSTGTFPRYHGVTAIVVRADDGDLVGSFSENPGNPLGRVMDPTVSMRKTTIGDLWDRANDNRPLIGMLAAGNLQAGMVGYGTGLDGGDADIAAIKAGDGWETNPEFYSLPEYVNTEVPGPDEFTSELDRADGAADGKWMGHVLEDLPMDATPAFAPWENAAMQAILEREGFGRDNLTDLFYVNYKAPDKAGHKWNMIGEEQEPIMRSVDDAIADMIEWLDTNVGEDEYVFVLTADHGQTPLGQGGWPILRNELVADIDRRYDKLDNGRSLIFRTSASSFFSDADEMRANDVSPETISSFVSRYTIGDNIPEGEEVPEGYEDRLDEPVFDAVFPGRKLPRVMACTQPSGATEN